MLPLAALRYILSAGLARHITTDVIIMTQAESMNVPVRVCSYVLPMSLAVLAAASRAQTKFLAG